MEAAGQLVASQPGMMTDADLELLDAFEASAIPLDQWNQKTHVSIAFLLLGAHPFEEALIRMRQGIREYNEVHGIADSPTTGYNETTTVAMLRIIHAVMLAYGETFPVRSAEEFCDLHPELMSKHLLRFFYSPGRRMDPAAKTEFLAPDLTELPFFPDKGEGQAERDA